MGLISKILPDKNSLNQEAIKVAQVIASKSPVAVQGSKTCIQLSRDRPIDDGLILMANWNMAMVQSEDLVKAVENLTEKSGKPPTFSDL